MKSYYNPVKVYFTDDYLKAVTDFVGSRKTILITSNGWRKRGLVDKVSGILGMRLINVVDNVKPNPTLDSIINLSKNNQNYLPDILLAIGGGSVIDTAKALSACLSIKDQNWLKNHFHKNKPFPQNFKPIPTIAIPTTAGTGSEVTMWATVWDMELKKKESLRHPGLYPEIAILDIELTMSAPKDIMIYSALDAFSHSFEAIWNKNANPVSDALAIEAAKIIFDTLPKAVISPENIELRKLLQKGSLLAGLAFSNTQTALAHSMSYPLTLNYGIPHGLACSFTLPEIIRWNNEVAPERLTMLVNNLNQSSADNLAKNIESLYQTLEILNQVCLYLKQGSELETIINQFITPERSDNNIRKTTQEEALNILRRALLH